jgi:predicted nucleotidyltransferase component of viral defense system
MNNVISSNPHHADNEIFREALAYSEASTGFTASLIEKDYYCSLVLRHFFAKETLLVFKGGTCISKVYTDFYRLSEDLDFIIPVAVDTSRSQRRTQIEPVKCKFNELPAVIPGIVISEELKGYNASKQYIGTVEYVSVVIRNKERIKIEVGLREPLLYPFVSNAARTIALNPFTGLSIISSFNVQSMEVKEAYAEKLRAALTRQEPAIRDFFDLFYAVNAMRMDLYDLDFLNIVKEKIKVPGNTPIDVSDERKQKLYRQMDGQLKPVLRPADFIKFNLEETFELVRSVAYSITSK